MATGDSVRQFLITAYDQGYINGDWVFMDVELFRFPGEYWGDHSWYRGDADDDKAKKAYEALLRISLYQPNGTHFRDFADEVRRRAKTDYGFDYRNEVVSSKQPICSESLH